MFTRLKISGMFNPTSELAGAQPSGDISVSGGPPTQDIGASGMDAGVVSAGDAPMQQGNPGLPAPPPTQAVPPGSGSPQGFGRLSVRQACDAIEARSRRIVTRGL